MYPSVCVSVCTSLSARVRVCMYLSGCLCMCVCVCARMVLTLLTCTLHPSTGVCNLKEELQKPQEGCHAGRRRS